MSCEPFAALIARGGELDHEELATLATHLASCDACRETATLYGIRSAASQLPRVAERTYLRERTLGEGGMGITYAAWDVRLERPVAIKEPRSDAREVAARFAREAKLTARLQHPAIVTVYEAGLLVDDLGERAFYAMEPVDGLPLDAEIASRPSLEDRLELLPQLTTIANAAAYAHERGVIHRDIKPGNILIGRFGEAVLIDWGLATEELDGTAPLDEVASGSLTRAGAGTPSYMPPEQATGVPADRRVDVYALGATLYHLLAGVPPYRGEQVRERLLAGPPAPCNAIERRIPKELVAIVGKAMARDPAARFADASALARELSRYQAGQLVESYAHSSLELLARWIKRHRAVLAVAAIAFAIVAGVATLSIRRIVAESGRADRERDQAVQQSELANRFIRNQLAAHQRICRIAGEVAAAHDVGQARQAMSRLGQQGMVITNRELADAIAALDDAVERWERGEQPEGDALGRIALSVPRAAKTAWRHLVDVALADEAALKPIVADIERDVLVEPLLRDADDAVAHLFDPDAPRRTAARDRFEQLYWGELYLVETGWNGGRTLEQKMVGIRDWLHDEHRDLAKHDALLADLARAGEDVLRAGPLDE